MASDIATKNEHHPYVYVFVRQDIPLAQQLVQAGHAAFEAGLRFHSPDLPISSLIALSAPDRKALLRAAHKLRHLGIAHHIFFEPDFEMGESALATEPLFGKARDPLRGYPLWKGGAV